MEMYSKRQEDLGAAAHCSRQIIGHYMRGRSEPRASTLVALSEELQCSVDYLVGKTSAPNPQKELAMDKLGLSDVAVAVINGESPHKRMFFQSNKELPLDDLNQCVAVLDEKREDIHRSVAVLLAHPEFEEAMLALETAQSFMTESKQAKLIQRRASEVLRSNVDFENYGRYLVDKEDAARLLKLRVMSHLEKAIDSLLNQNTASAEKPKR